MFGPMAKWVAQIDHAERIPELVSRAFRVATSGRPGPVVLALPEDMLVEEADVARRAARTPPAQAAPARADLERVARAPRRGRAAARDRRRAPWSAEAARRARRRGATASGMPVASAWRCQDYVDNDAACYVGHLGLGADPALAQRLRDADVLLVVGDRLSEITTAGYTAIVPPGSGAGARPRPPDPDEIGRVYEPTLGIVASGPRFARGALALPPLDPAAARRADARGAHAEYLDEPRRHVRCPATVDMGDVMAALRDRLAGRRDPHERGRQLLGLGAPLLRVPPLPRRSSRRRAARWGTACPPRSRPSSLHPERTWSRSRATATS